ncbi:hypothetical protein [Legionella longbeachae]|uniref:hypothetical protein n=1 Tax=Legionella longbeachae TaxID=450 RepID=UPI001F0EB4E9|nr:hypothetical protein [Legionella longbeachae]
MQNFPFRSAQEDALIWETLEQSLVSLNPEEIGKRLWTTYRILDEQILKMEYTDGTTASTTVFDGRSHFITATLADAASFAAIYDNEECLLGAIRLNSVTHKPTDPEEALRIEQAGGLLCGTGLMVFSLFHELLVISYSSNMGFILKQQLILRVLMSLQEKLTQITRK